MDSPYSIMQFSIHGEERAFTFKIVFCRLMEVTLDYLFWMEQVRDSLRVKLSPQFVGTCLLL